jgi:hypothetical protein
MLGKRKRKVRLAIMASLFSITIPAMALAQDQPFTRSISSLSSYHLSRTVESSAPVLFTAGVTGQLLGWEASPSVARRPITIRIRSVVVASRTVAVETRPKVSLGRSTAPLYHSTSGADWYAIAQCESGGRWNINTGNGYWGGLQFAPHTWFAYGGGPFDGVGPFPYSAAQQIAVAERVLAGQGPGAWPVCYRSR